MLFPQLSTVQTTANSSSYLFWGFRELGRMVGSNLKVNSAGRIELRVEEQCKQVAHPLAKKGHNRRWIVEVAHSWFTRFRKLLVRYEKLDRSFLVFNHLAIAISSEATPFRGTIVAAST